MRVQGGLCCLLSEFNTGKARPFPLPGACRGQALSPLQGGSSPVPGREADAGSNPVWSGGVTRTTLPAHQAEAWRPGLCLEKTGAPASRKVSPQVSAPQVSEGALFQSDGKLCCAGKTAVPFKGVWCCSSSSPPPSPPNPRTHTLSRLQAAQGGRQSHPGEERADHFPFAYFLSSLLPDSPGDQIQASHSPVLFKFCFVF